MPEDSAKTKSQLLEELAALRRRVRELEESAEEQRPRDRELTSWAGELNAGSGLVRAMTENMLDMLWVKDLKGRFLFANKAIREQLLHSDDIDALGRTDIFFAKRQRALGHKHDFGELCVDSDKIVIESGQPGTFIEDGLVRGKYLCLEVRKSPLYDQSGAMVGTVGTGRDITQQKKIEAALHKSQERFALAMDASKDGLWDWNIASGDVYFSPGYKAMIGYGEDEFPGRVSSWSELIHPDDKQATLAANQQSIDGNADSFEVEFRMQAKSGDWRWILGRGKVVDRDASGKATRMVGTHTDITDRKHFEEKLQAALKERESMLLEVHHRVKNNLQVILSLLDLSGYRAKKPETMDFIKEVQGKINSMALIHSELYMEEALSEIDIARYMRLLATKVRALYEKHGVTLDINENAVTLGIDKALPVGLVLNELITNAFKYAFPQGEGTLRCRVDRQGESMRLEVADDGPGLPCRVDPLNTKTLGFKLVREIAGMQLHGRMTVSGDKGTTVSITFPV